MIPIELQDYLVKSTKNILKGFKVKNSLNELSEFNIYPQNIPVKQGKKDKEHYPLIVIAIEEGRGPDDENGATANVTFLIGTYDSDENNQGFRDGINAANKIIDFLCRATRFDGKHTLLHPIDYKFPDEQLSPYYLVVINTTWNVPQITMQDDQYT